MPLTKECGKIEINFNKYDSLNLEFSKLNKNIFECKS